MRTLFLFLFVNILLLSCGSNSNDDAEGNYFYVPTAFSSNGDGLNDTWCIYTVSP